MKPVWDLNKVGRSLTDLSSPSEASVIGRFRLVRKVGIGAMGTVYEAEDTEIHRTVALKVLSGPLAQSEAARRRFQIEAKAAASISHPNVVRVHDAVETGDRLCLVMEFVRGKSLHELLSEKRPALPALLGILHKAALGVAAAHARGVIHRDIKPSNIMVTEEGEPKVGDFGLAHFLDAETRLTRPGAAVGTPGYMAPEQARGDLGRIGPATDVYGLGVILYEILTGRLPHVGKDWPEVLDRILHKEPQRPAAIRRDIPAGADAICLKALEKDPDRRYPTAREFADDLGRHLSGEGVHATVPGPGSRVWKWIRRYRLAWAILGAMLLLSFLVVEATLAKTAARRRAVGDFLDRGDRASRERRLLATKLAELRKTEGELQGALDPDRRRQLKDLRREVQEVVRRYVAGSAEAASWYVAAAALDPEARRPPAEATEDEALLTAPSREEAGWWKLDELGATAVDYSANRNDGAHRNGPSLSADAAPVRFPNSGSLQFDGVDDCVEIPTAPYRWVTDTFTLAFWAKPAAARAATPEVRGGISQDSGQRFAIHPTQGEYAYGALFEAGAGVSVGTNGVSVFEHSGAYRPSVLVHDVALTGWTHVAVVYAHAQPTLYVNGIAVRTGRISEKHVHPGCSLGGDGSASGPYKGWLDDVRLYARALDAEEVAALAAGNPTIRGAR